MSSFNRSGISTSTKEVYKCSIHGVALTNSVNFIGKASDGVPFKVAKEDSITGVFLWALWNNSEQLSSVHPGTYLYLCVSGGKKC